MHLLTGNALAFDIATSCGWALQLGEERRSGVERFDLAENEHPGLRWPRVRRRLSEMARPVPLGGPHGRLGPVDVIVWEQVITPPTGRKRSSFSPALLFAFEAAVVETCGLLGIESHTLMPSALKRLATGAGNATKADVVAATRAVWPWVELATHDQADALWVLEWARWRGWDRCRCGDERGEHLHRNYNPTVWDYGRCVEKGCRCAAFVEVPRAA